MAYAEDDESVGSDLEVFLTDPIVERILPSALEQAVDAAVVINAENIVLFFNASAEKLWGYDRTEVLGRNVSCLLPEHMRAVHDSYVNAHRVSGVDRIVGSTREVVAARKDGSLVWVELSLSRVDVEGAAHYMALLRDISAEIHQREDNRMLSLIVDNTDQAILVLGEDRRVIRINPAFSDMFGYSAEDMIGQRPGDFLSQQAGGAETVECMQGEAWLGQAFRADVLGRRRDGSAVRVSVSVCPMRRPDGEVSHVILVMTDITERWHIETMQSGIVEAMANGLSLREVMNEFCQRLEEIAPEIVSSVMAVDDGGRLAVVAGPSLPEHYARTLDGLSVADPEGRDVPFWRGEQLVSTDIASDPLWDEYGSLVLPLGLSSCWSLPIKGRDGQPVGSFTLYFRDKRGPAHFHRELLDACLYLCVIAFEREAGREEVTRLAHFDPLTGLPNRAHIYRCIDGFIDDAPDSSFAVMVLDLDHFKDLNDTRGHAWGDKLLFEVASRLEQLSRSAGLVGRIDGDTFVIVYKDCPMHDAPAMAEGLLSELRRSFQIDSLPFSLTASIGIAQYPENGTSSEELVTNADLAMHRSKSSGRGRYMFFSPEMNALASERLVLGVRLREAIAHQRLALYYQPQIWTERGSLCAVEALSRWIDPELGMIPPDKFIPLAEEIGEIAAIGRWSLREACRQMSAWRTAGLTVPSVSVNISAREFGAADLPDYIGALLREFDLPPSALTLEITETAMMDADAETFATVGRVRRLGVGLSMDDFGTGYSSLASLARLPVTEIKIDRSFMRDIEQDAGTRALAMAVVRIGQSLGLSVVAEGVETVAQADILAALGCEVLQGYLFSRPLPPRDFEAWLRSFRPSPRPMH